MQATVETPLPSRTIVLPPVAAPAVRTVALRDGTRLPVRALQPTDRDVLETAINRLSPQSRYRRFAAPLPRVPERTLRRLLDLDHHEREALVAYDPTTGDALAVARWAADPAERGVAEIAVTVGDAWQRRGLGLGLARMLLRRARAEGLVALRATALAENRAAIALLERLGFRLSRRDGILVDFALEL